MHTNRLPYTNKADEKHSTGNKTRESSKALPIPVYLALSLTLPAFRSLVPLFNKFSMFAEWLCTAHMHKFIAFAHDISTVKAFRNFSHLKRLRLRIDDAFSGETGWLLFCLTLFFSAEAQKRKRFHQNQKTTRRKRKTKSNQKTLLSKREIKLNVLFG